MTPMVFIVDGVRTPMAEYNGAFAEVGAKELAVAAGTEALRRAAVEPREVGHVVVGNVIQSSRDAIYLARHVGLGCGAPVETPALTVNRLCGSGIQALIEAAFLIQGGEAEVVLAGGTENMTQAPHVLRGARRGFRWGPAELEDMLVDSLTDSHCGLAMAITSDNIARAHGISREEQDAFALASQRKAAAGWSSGRLAEEVVPVTAGRGRRQTVVERDDHMRPDTTAEGLAALKPAFDPQGFVTAGNASGVVDGAAMRVGASEQRVARGGRRPLARIVSWAVAGVEPATMGMGPVPATRRALEKAGLALEDVDLFEINEAFAGQILGVLRELPVPPERLNVNGGAIALGHPLGASGARLVLTLAKELRRRGGGKGVAAACIGGGQGIAMVIEVE